MFLIPGGFGVLCKKQGFVISERSRCSPGASKSIPAELSRLFLYPLSPFLALGSFIVCSCVLQIPLPRGLHLCNCRHLLASDGQFRDRRRHFWEVLNPCNLCHAWALCTYLIMIIRP